MTYQPKYAYGCKLSRRHIADLSYAPDLSKAPTMPILSWRSECPPVFNQGQTSSCTGNAAAGVIQLSRALDGLSAMASHPSRLFLYYNGRAKRGLTGEDGGASIRDVAEAACELGYCDEDQHWPFSPDQVTVKPSDEAYVAAKADTGSQFSWLDMSGPALIAGIKTALANKDPILFGITVYESFEGPTAAKTGIIPMPQWYEQCLGGHAVCIVGWNDHIKCFEVRNSWGDGWGDKGYCWIPYAFVQNPVLASDFGVLKLVK